MKKSRLIHRVAGMVLCLCAGVALSQSGASSAVAGLESDYADLVDAAGAISLIDSGLTWSYNGKDRKEWQRSYDKGLKRLGAALAKASAKGVNDSDARALEVMRSNVLAMSEADSLAPTGRCADASRKNLDYDGLTQSLYACFDELGNQIEFENARETGIGAFDLLARMDDADRRKALFHAFQPLWTAVNGANETDSPYRRVIKLAAARARASGSAIDAAAKTVGTSSADVEQWLVKILDTWRTVSGEEMVEPWDYRYVGGAAERELAPFIALEAMQPINERFYLDLGADLKKWCTLYDLKPRSGKAPLAYTDYVQRGRVVDGKWRRTIARVSANYEYGRLGSLNELVHENGHAVHMMALRTRPAFMDLGDAVFYEAFADVPSWNTYEPAWQKKYIGQSASGSASLRGLYSNVMLDVAWALFELRMLRDPVGDPNAVWTDITQTYLHVKPHPELAWWAVRVQLVDSPGYMVNYGLGAVLTADIRKHIAAQLGPFTLGDTRWFDWLAQNLLSSGQEKETSVLLRDFLGRSPSPDALLGQLRRIGATQDD